MTNNLFFTFFLFSFLLDGRHFPVVVNGQTYEDCDNANAVYCDDNKPDKIAVCFSKVSNKGIVTSAKTSCVTPTKKVKKGVTIDCGCCDEEIARPTKKSSSTTGSSSSKSSKSSKKSSTPAYCLSEMPSDMPSEVPSELPTEFPLPTLIPSEIPSEVPSEMPSEVPSGCPTSTGGGKPGDDCVDDPNFTHQGDSSKDCDWVAEKPANRCKKEWKKISVKVWCPVTCDTCDEVSSNIFTQS